MLVYSGLSVVCLIIAKSCSCKKNKRKKEGRELAAYGTVNVVVADCPLLASVVLS